MSESKARIAQEVLDLRAMAKMQDQVFIHMFRTLQAAQGYICDRTCVQVDGLGTRAHNDACKGITATLNEVQPLMEKSGYDF